MKLTEKYEPLLSVIVPIYNSASYLSECLDSLRNQTLSNIEIICVNDGSTDGSLDILRKYEQEDKRFRILDQKNQGVSVARNCGISIARGKYISFVDSDDYIDLSYSEQVVSFAEKYQLELVNVRSKEEYLRKKKIPYFAKLTNEVQFGQTLVYNNITEKQRELFLYFAEGSYHAVVRKDVWDKYNIAFPVNVRVNEDYYVFFKLYAVIRNIGFLFPVRSLYHYRFRSDSVSHTAYVCDTNEKSKIWDMFVVFKGVKQFYLENGMSCVYRSLIIRYLLEFEVMYFNIPQNQRVDYLKELSSCWDDTFDEILDDPQYLPFARRYFWFWLRGGSLRRKIIGNFVMALRSMKHMLS